MAMNNAELWQPSKFVVRRGHLTASRDPAEVGVACRLAVDIVAGFYERHLPIHCRGRVVDLGCGKVPLYGAYRNRADEVTCVDWAGSLHRTSHLDLECDLTRPLPFEDARFDTIILSDVLEHIPTPGALWGEMSRILAPGGKLLLNVPFFYWLHEEPHDYYRYTGHALRRFSENVGLDVVSIEPLGGTPEVLADVIAKHLHGGLPLVGGLLARMAQGCARLLLSTRPGRRLSARTASKFPLGYFLVASKGGSTTGSRQRGASRA